MSNPKDLTIEVSKFRIHAKGKFCSVTKRVNFDGDVENAEITWSSIGAVGTQEAIEYCEELRFLTSFALDLDNLIVVKEDFKKICLRKSKYFSEFIKIDILKEISIFVITINNDSVHMGEFLYIE